MPLKILIVTQYFWPENFQINHLVRGLRERGHDVTVLTGKPNYPEGRIYPGFSFFGRSSDQFGDVPVIRVPLIPRGAARSIRLAVNYLSFAISGAIGAVFRVKGDFDLIFVYQVSPITVGLPAIIAKYRLRAPILFWVQDLWPESVTAAGGVTSRFVLKPLEALTRFIYSRCDRILVQSKAFQPSTQRFGATESQLVYFPQSVDDCFKPLNPADAAEEGALMTPGFKLVFAGNVGQAQDFETVVAAAERLRDEPRVKWVIIGDGRRHSWLKDEIARRGLGDRFSLLGRYPEDKMASFFAHADALLVTLRKEPIFALTIPTKIQAYLACGKPIVACLDGEGARIIEEASAGFTAPSGDADALARAVQHMLKLSPEERAAMSAKALDYSRRNFDRTVLLDRLINLMHEVVDEQTSKQMALGTGRKQR